MKKNKNYIMALGLTVCLTGCYMDGQRADTAMSNNGADQQTMQAQATHTAQQSGSSKAPAQKTTPGPKRAAAPKIPVIQ